MARDKGLPSDLQTYPDYGIETGLRRGEGMKSA